MERVRFAVIGVKGFGMHHIDAIIHNKKAKLIAVCDIDKDAAEKAAEECGVEYCTDYHELLNRGDIDAVDVVTPDHIHREMVIDLLNAGKNVLCEKPMALNLDDCRAMLAAADASDAKLMVGQICRMTDGFILAKKLVDEGAIGELVFVESEYAHDYSHMPYHWRKDPELKRHPVTGGGCHAVDLLRWIAGNPTEAFAYSNKKALLDWPCDDCTISLLKFPNDVMGKVLVATGCKRNYTMRTVLYGTKGTIITDNTSPTITLYSSDLEGKDKLYGYGTAGLGVQYPVVVNNHNVAKEVEELISAVLGEKELEVTGAEGAATVAVCEAIIASTKSGLPEKIKYIE